MCLGGVPRVLEGLVFRCSCRRRCHDQYLRELTSSVFVDGLNLKALARRSMSAKVLASLFKSSASFQSKVT